MTSLQRIAIFCSDSGSNAEVIMQKFEEHPRIRVAMLLSNEPDSYALVRAEKYNVPTYVFSNNDLLSTDHIASFLVKQKLNYLVLANFALQLPNTLLQAFPDRIFNIKPVPSGKGIEIHLVKQDNTEGEVLYTANLSNIDGETAAELTQRVTRLEHSNYSEVIEDYIEKNRG